MLIFLYVPLSQCQLKPSCFNHAYLINEFSSVSHSWCSQFSDIFMTFDVSKRYGFQSQKMHKICAYRRFTEISCYTPQKSWHILCPIHILGIYKPAKIGTCTWHFTSIRCVVWKIQGSGIDERTATGMSSADIKQTLLDHNIYSSKSFIHMQGLKKYSHTLYSERTSF